MEKYIFMLLGVILGIAISVYVYSNKKELYIKRVKDDQDKFSTKKLDEILEISVKQMQNKMVNLGRRLTEDEKNAIIFENFDNNNKCNL